MIVEAVVIMIRKIALLAAVAVIAAVGWSYFGKTEYEDPLGAAFAQDASDVDTSMIEDMTLGNPDSNVTMIEYASFTCPHCRAFHEETFETLKADYIDNGKINFVYREVYFDRPGLWAGIVARCGEGAENRYFGIAEMLYERQKDWATQNDPAEIVASLRQIGKTAGLSDADLDQCFTDADNAEALYAYFRKTTEEHGVESTPSFVINDVLYRNMSYDELKEVLDEALAAG